jgi:glycine cleavage system protein P-like pyridoxal-binding family
MTSITLKGREIPLLYTTWEMKEIQEELGPISRAIMTALGRNPDNHDDASLFGSAEHLKAAATLIRILGNAGLEEAGEPADLTNKKILRALKPADMMTVINECMNAVTEGMASEMPDKDEEGPVDVTLEDMKKKEMKDG